MIPLPTLDMLTIPTPCNVSWETMTGDDRTRFCGQCRQQVHDVSFLTRAEADALLQSDEHVCLRIFRRPDGNVMTRDCQELARKGARRFVTRWLVGLGLFGHVFTAIDLIRRHVPKHPVMLMGEPSMGKPQTVPPQPLPPVAQQAPENPPAKP